ncbi:hypothetical protein GIB67_002517 [Kingdonia uniflora]|uniref:Uncharacterized protein n=1 Tax=Kingdonia uniflora TaxID=39325 RepID=A0A7J7N916_9MAGN|nr:hypothetical protein GIB67_002517 [Kingdonia uniflora]
MISPSSQGKEVHIPEANREYTTWMKRDQLLLSWIISSLSEDVFAHVMGLSTLHVVWTTLAKYFALSSCSRVKSIGDNLAIVASPVSNEDMVSSLFKGLSSKYDSLITSVTTNVDPVGLEKLSGFLLCQEIHQEMIGSIETPPPILNVVTKDDNL